MPKVVREYKAQARHRIVEAASAAFRRNGFRSTTMEDIAEEVGVSKGAIYLYFRTKSELLAEIQARSRAQVLERWKGLLESGDVAEGIARSLDEIFSGEIDPGVWHELMAEAAIDPAVQRALRVDQREDRRIMRDFLRDLEARGRVRKLRDPETVAEMILGLLHASVLDLMLRGDAAESRRTLVRSLRYLLEKGS
jgi:AcrR family transcriptional regulator